MESKPLRKAFGYHPQELGLDLLRTISRNNIKVTGAVLTHQGHLPLVDAMGIDNDLGRRGLPEDFRESDGRNPLGADNIRQHRPWANRWQLIHIGWPRVGA